MIAGRNPFAQPTSTETLAAILDEDLPGCDTPLTSRRCSIISSIAASRRTRAAFSIRARPCLSATRDRPRSGPRSPRASARFGERSSHSGGRGNRARGTSVPQRPAELRYRQGNRHAGVTTLAILPLVNTTASGPRLSRRRHHGERDQSAVRIARPPRDGAADGVRVQRSGGGSARRREAVGGRDARDGKLGLRGETLHIQADLIDTRSGAQIWGRTFDAPRQQISALADASPPTSRGSWS